MSNSTTSTAPLLLETIRLVDGGAPLLAYHQERVNNARKQYYAKRAAFKLSAVLEELNLPATGLHKLRLTYGERLIKHEIIPYRIRPVNSLRIVHADDLRYGKKFADRSELETLFGRRGDCDDVVIVQQNHITDASYANLALYDGTHWYTPAWPLLKGTRRAKLLQHKVVRPAVIRLKDIQHFQQIRLMNAMMEWEEGPTVRIEAVQGWSKG